MSLPLSGYRVVVAATVAVKSGLHEVFQHEALAKWEVLDANSFEQAFFVLQHDLCNVLLIDQSLCDQEGWQSLAWVDTQPTVPVLLLADAAPEQVAEALEDGVNQWLPRQLAFANPELLAAALGKEAYRHGLRRHQQSTGESLRDCRRQVSRLLHLLWEVSPTDPQTHWFTQRHMFERLQEEIARAKRYGVPLSIVLGEIEGPVDVDPELAGPRIDPHVAERMLQAKRRSDVVGHYGPNAFLLLLAHTTEQGAKTYCNRLHEILHLPEKTAGPHRPNSFFGIASFSETVATPQGLLSKAEQSLEHAKQLK